MPYPFDRSGTEVGPDGIRRYTGLAQNLLQLLRAAVEASPDAEALVDLGGERVTYRQPWTRATRVAGGLRAAGVQPGDRVANRLINGNDWVYAFWGTLLAGATVSGEHPVRRAGGALRRRGLRRHLRGGAWRRAARRRAAGGHRPGPRRSRGDLLHQRDDGLPQGRDDDP